METFTEESAAFHWLQGFTFDKALHFARMVEFDLRFSLSFTSNNKEEEEEDDDEEEDEMDKVG